MLRYNTGFTFVEMLIILVILGVFSLVGVWFLYSYYGQNQVGNNVVILEQAIRNTKRLAQSKSSVVYLDLSAAGTIQSDEEGGLIEIKANDGTILDSISLGKNVVISTLLTTFPNDHIAFNYEGSPVDETESVTGITSSNNTVIIGYQSADGIANTYSITVEPITGDIQRN